MSKVVALAGGVGGAKLAYGLYHAMPPENLTIIVNTGDDFEHLGLHISPDLDTIMYTLADLANPKTGWGVRDESWGMMTAMKRYGGPTWFNLGDQDLATHLLRTHWLREGQSHQQITQTLSHRLGIRCSILPMSNDPIRTKVQTSAGELPFQTYFVEQRAAPIVTGLRFEGAEKAAPADELLEALQQADLIVLCPSNPLLSIDPILAVPSIRQTILESNAPKIGVSPIVGGQAIKGPAAKIMAELGMDVSPVGVARHLQAVLTDWVIDTIDYKHRTALEAMGLQLLVTETIMQSNEDRIRLAHEILSWAEAKSSA